MTFNIDRAGELALALMYLTLHDGSRAWKGIDWDVLDHLHQEGFIEDPKGKAKSVVLTEAGIARAHALFQQLFAEPRVSPAAEAVSTAGVSAKGSLPDIQQREAKQLLAPLCALPDDARIRAQLRKEIRFERNAVVLLELRPRFDRPDEWVEHPVARFRYVKSRRVWELYCMFRDLEWHHYEPLPASPTLAPLVDEVRRDPTGIFWG